MSSLTGLHSVNVFYAGKPINNSPFGVRVAPSNFLLTFFSKKKKAISHLFQFFSVYNL